MNNTTLLEIIRTNEPDKKTGFTELEGILLYAIGVLLILFILQSVCFIVYIIKPKRNGRQKHTNICMPKVRREPPQNQENNSERYSSRLLKKVSDPEIYESLKDLKEAPPLPPISTLPRRKLAENDKLLDSLSSSHSDAEEFVSLIATRPRQPLPNEIEASIIMSKNNFSQTMPRMQIPKPVPTPIMSSTISRYTNRGPPLVSMKPKRPIKPEILPPKPPPTNLSLASHHIPVVNHPEFRNWSKPKSPVEVQNKHTLPPSEPNNEIPVDNELMEKLKKRARLIPSSTEIPVQQITNNPTCIQPQQIKHEPYVQDELMQKLKKRAALIPDAQNPINSALRVKTPKFKPLPPTPPRSDSEDTWVDDFDTDVQEQIHTYIT